MDEGQRVSNLSLLRALIADLTELANNLETLEDACYSAPHSSRYGSRPLKGQHSDPTARTVANFERARLHLKEADKKLKGPILSLMGRLKYGSNHHARLGIMALSKLPDERARHEAGEAPSKDVASA